MGWNAQIAPDRTIFVKIFPGHATPLARVGLCIITIYLCICYVLLFLDNKLIIMRKFQNAAQIYTYLMKLEFNKCIGPNSNCRQLYHTKKYFTLSMKNIV